MKFKITRYDDKTRLQLTHYNNLRKYYYKLIEEIMGEDYYTISPDVMNSDTEAYEDMIYRIKYLKETIIYKNNLILTKYVTENQVLPPDFSVSKDLFFVK